MSEFDFSDRPSDTDLLNISELQTGIAVLIQKAARPFVMAVIGPWGSGKTTIVNHSIDELPKNYVKVVFDAWAHSKGRSLLRALFVHLSTLASKGESESEEPAEKHLWKTAKDKLKKVAQNPVTAAVPRLFSPLLARVGLSGEETARILERLRNEKELDIDTDFAEDLINDFMEIASVFKNNEKELLIFIDDLDRCTPMEALDLIDDIKVYLTIDAHVVFIVALDRRTLHMGIKAKYGPETEINVDEYLQKIFSHVVYMPDYGELDDFVRSALECVPLKETIDLLGIAIRVISQCRVSNIRTIKRVVRKWGLLIPSNINDYLRKAEVGHGITSNTEQLAQYILWLCFLLELYPDYYEHIMTSRLHRIIERLTNPVGDPDGATKKFLQLCLTAKGERTDEAARQATLLQDQKAVLFIMIWQLLHTSFLSHKDSDDLRRGYEKSIPQLVRAVHLGIPLIM